jgi:hypothetical protein
MKKLLRTTLLSSALILGGSAMAAPTANFSLGGYFGSINNNTTRYAMEMTQVMGGYAANNPMPANGYIQMAPDPGAAKMAFHLMVIDKAVPGRYAANYLIHWAKQSNGEWKYDVKVVRTDKNLQLLHDDKFSALVLQSKP